MIVWDPQLGFSRAESQPRVIITSLQPGQSPTPNPDHCEVRSSPGVSPPVGSVSTPSCTLPISCRGHRRGSPAHSCGPFLFSRPLILSPHSARVHSLRPSQGLRVPLTARDLYSDPRGSESPCPAGARSSAVSP